MKPNGSRRHGRRKREATSAAEAARASGGASFTRLGLAVAIVLATLVAFAPALRAPFQFDDLETIPGNVSIRRLWPLSVPLSPPSDIATTGRPVVNFSLALNYALNEQLGVDQRPESPDRNRTLGFHLFNLFIHLASGALLFGIVRRTLRSARLARAWGESADTIGAVIAALWLLHPIQSEAVNYLTQRTELLMSVLFLATLYCAIRGWESSARGERLRWFALSIVACLLGMGSKEVMIMAPLVVFLYDRAIRQDSWSDAFRLHGERLWYYVLLAVTALWVVWFIVVGARAETVGFGLGIPWYRYLYSQAWAVGHYLRLAVWPSGLVVDYGRDPVSGLRGVPGAIVLLALLAASIVAMIRKPAVGFLGAWFFLILAPSSSVVPIRTEIAAERRIYLAFAALVVALVIGAVVLMRRLRHDTVNGVKWRSWLTASNQRWAVATLCAALGIVTYQRSRLFGDPEALWRDAIAKVPSNPRAHHNLALALLEQDPPRVSEAEAALRHAIALDSTYLPAWPNLASIVGLQGNTAEERKLLEHVVSVSPHYVQALQQLGFLLVSEGKSAEALVPLEQVSVEAPGDETFVALATAYTSLHRPADAVVALRRAIQLNPDRADAMSYLGSTLTEAGDAAAAVPVLEEALSRGLESGFVYATLGLAYAQVGRADDATRAALTGAERAGSDASVLVIAGRALLAAGHAGEAARVLAVAVQLVPTDPEAVTRAGMAKVAQGDKAAARKDFLQALAIDPQYELAKRELSALDHGG